ncbi:MAG: hypothetical protein AAGI52_14885 [Bacteroidota bacterium]
MTQARTEASAIAAASDITVLTTDRVSSTLPALGTNLWASVSFEILAPRTTNLDIGTHNGNIVIEGITGRINTNTGNGDIRLDRVDSEGSVTSINGSIEIRMAPTASGHNGLLAEARQGNLRAEGIEGNISCGDSGCHRERFERSALDRTGRLHARSGNGTVSLLEN